MPPSPEVIGNAGQAAPRPLVSIITPSLNQARFIRDTIESVLAQDYPRIEYLVLDGGSTDGALEVIREYEGRLEWVCEKDSGQANTLNRGFRRVHGDIVAWLNSDDVLLPRQAVTTMVERFTALPEAGLVYGDGFLMDVDDNVVQEMQLGEPNLWELMHLYGHMVLGAAIFYRAEALAAVGYLDEGWHWQFDYDLFLRLCTRYPYAHIPIQVAAVRSTPTRCRSPVASPATGSSGASCACTACVASPHRRRTSSLISSSSISPARSSGGPRPQSTPRWPPRSLRHASS